MKTRFALTLMALLPILVACKAQDGSSDTAPAPAPAAETATAPAATPATDAAAPPAVGESANAPATDTDTAAAPPAPAPRAPNGPEPVAGTDYLDIEGGQPYQQAAGKIEVAEVFGYVCPACNAFQPLIGPWKAGLPSDVHFVYVPAMFGGTWDDYARAFYAAETLGVQEKTHDALYKAIHVDQSLKGERGKDSVQDIAGFYAKYGVDSKTFIDTMSSFGVSAKTNRAKQFATRSKITGTPSLIVNGKYLVKGQSFPDMLRIADHLIARERATLAK
ncbi:thiol:disulfide interchange protein DsbA/DsbL [Xanthomonas campestris]|uniref:thiol:disulfide interchange protein DsbA/DsbL n=1 Tax=Xanthomonas campestris TaxID=339 RepID=UPI002366A10D|nr:thiol:disulfide interchange protein DsbA/DsbL [Xanthomonas campestris]MEA9712695.1 thiol:disulfide interchange protein DsbA/DsbL [Xanthomonas campestris]MEA9783612.1 thiol:disulfide interchange protein DsbA/DsbL [Xanthomonas campestris pv. raphani]MEA9791819.1 thiol:disulfide interchange protein DsbA/DsbL [Xanthomonas campestris pv. raphani]MEA9794945.1 thiol:disulfide interchange protein DsbA/DsbL [Xanthomonas campestris pv. raphani]MEA9802901.1 thiol:disulfide interchange protein DsbA/Dsb